MFKPFTAPETNDGISYDCAKGAKSLKWKWIGTDKTYEINDDKITNESNDILGMLNEDGKCALKVY